MRSRNRIEISLFDIDCDIAKSLVEDCRSRRISATPYRFLEAELNQSGSIFLGARYSSSTPKVRYVFSPPRAGVIFAECGWNERFVNVGMSDAKTSSSPVCVYRGSASHGMIGGGVYGTSSLLIGDEKK